MNSIGSNIKKLRKSRGLTQQRLADVVGAKNYTTITKWESGDNVPQGKDLIVLSKFFNVSVDSILGIDGKVNTEKNTGYPYLPSTISAGLPLEVDGITEAAKIQIPDSIMGKWAGKNDIFISRINGDSMNKVIADGSLIAIKPITLDNLKNGDMVVFSNNHDYSVKYYHRQGKKIIFKPASDNLAHHEQHYSIDDNIEIHGKVVVYIVELD